MYEIEGKVCQAALLYFRLVLAVGPVSSGKSALLRTLKDSTGAPLLNVNLQLSRRLLELGERSRTARLPRILDDIVEAEANGADTVLLDNTELLFDARLRQDPLRLLRDLSRHRTIVAAWLGSVRNGALTYAEVGHPEYRSYLLGESDGPLIANLGDRA